MSADQLGERIRLLRNILGLSQGEAAEKIGTDQSRFSKWEGNNSTPRPRQLRALAGLTDDPENWFRYLREGGAPPQQRADQRRAGDVLSPLTLAQQSAYGAIHHIGERLKAIAREGRDLENEQVAALAVIYTMMIEPEMSGSLAKTTSVRAATTIDDELDVLIALTKAREQAKTDTPQHQPTMKKPRPHRKKRAG